MILFPAIDILDGKVVRLFQGRFDEVTQYGKDPLAMASYWKQQGAQWLHLVDLDGAKEGVMVNRDMIARIARDVGIPVQVGGGIREEAAIEFLLNEAAVSRVILGTKAIEDKAFLKRMIDRFQEKICVSLDCAQGLVTGRGWVATTKIKGVDLAKELQDLGLQWLVYTDIARDGTLAGPNFKELEHLLSQVTLNVIASGGISNIEDVKRLATMNVAAAITGKAIYEGKLDFKEAMRVCDKKTGTFNLLED